MYFKMSRTDLLNMLSIVSKAISSNSPLPSLLGVKFDVKSNKIELTGSDSDISIKTTKEKSDDAVFEVYEEGSIVINKNYITDIIRKIDSDVVEFEIIDGSLTKISGNSSEYRINGIKSYEYPLIDFSKPEKQFSISSTVLKNIINQTYFATCVQETRPALTGINFNCDQGKMTCIATDSYRLARKIVNLDEDVSFNITIPAKSLLEVSRLLDKEELVTVSLTDKKAQFICNNTIIQTRLIDGAYPDTSRFVPVSFKYELNMDIKDLLNAIDRQSFIKNENDTFCILKLSMNEDEIIISSRSQEIGSSKEKLNFESYVGEPLELSFSGKYVYDALKGLNGNKVKIQFCGEMKPFIITSLEDDSTLQLVLPVRTFS
ncbi:MAG: DNA polymerase III subunit beta [Erysipelotrichaceae bacterium]|nr:DNA polymerase III subunit beta [Erysipelotrichaceae bacterium]